MSQSTLFWRLPHDVRRCLFRIINAEEYKILASKRAITPEKETAETFKPFLDTGSLFVHIPKTAGISLGNSIYGRHTGNHTTIAEYQLAFSKKEFDSMFKFTFVRNPWDRLLSAFLYMKKGGRNPGDRLWSDTHIEGFEDFQSFVLSWVNEINVMKGVHFLPQNHFITLPGSDEILVDFVGRFESLENDWRYLTNRISALSVMAQKNVNTYRKRDYRPYYSDEMVEIVTRVYQKDIELFQYDF